VIAVSEVGSTDEAVGLVDSTSWVEFKSEAGECVLRRELIEIISPLRNSAGDDCVVSMVKEQSEDTMDRSEPAQSRGLRVCVHRLRRGAVPYSKYPPYKL
jgi:hypothetical protein